MSAVNAVIVGIDVGGSKTALRAIGSEGFVVTDVVVQTDSWRGEDWAGKARVLTRLIADTVTGHIEAVAVGAHGCDTDEQCAALAQEISLRLDVPVRVVNDAGLLAHAAGRPDAVGLIVGTGAIAVGSRPDGGTVHAGGWGWLVGDDGGAAGLVREGVRAVLLAADGGVPDQILERALIAASGQESVGELSHRMMLDRAEQWALLAPAIFAAAEDGSPVAATVLENAIDALAALVLAVGQKGAALENLVIGGGVASAQRSYAARIASRILAASPRTSVTILTESPVTGALELARSIAVAPYPVPSNSNPEG
ncbi:N-acetylglucosamine kinase [Leifsonia sp. 2TAF2]|uniref:N-acetylglucosamine kinase n=1 Tax=Leifsonia sp. 2TAF2 TaxID=3233009 RepID=UPI003F9B5F5C